MSIYNETTVPCNKYFNDVDPNKPLLVISKPFMAKLKNYMTFSKSRSEIPLYVDETTNDNLMCDSRSCKILQYSILLTSSVAILGLIAYYSYVCYRIDRAI
ncbi:hypothetical protein [Mocis latipes granulovirus]|uniref:Uncharacterized protein n=1 Tax=Mocis latipes granulovirus TaxID=2072024 RepID=A0A161C739_9BBAC|nr:hypothetical protein [Mocis latipes granulovirus]AKR17475.1 hypothetical protein [Mocis latipes granulovirus]